MIITEIKATPLIVPYKEPYYWAQGIMDGAGVLLVEIKTDSGLIGYGESISTPSPQGVHAFIKEASKFLIGENPFHISSLWIRFIMLCSKQEGLVGLHDLELK